MLILVIDRNDAVAAAMGDYLEHAGDQVDFAADGTTALRLAQTRPYDVIVVDAAESALAGWRVTRRLRAQGSADPPILVLTARNALQSTLDGFAAGGDDCLAKPFDSLELRAPAGVGTPRHRRVPSATRCRSSDGYRQRRRAPR